MGFQNNFCYDVATKVNLKQIREHSVCRDSHLGGCPYRGAGGWGGGGSETQTRGSVCFPTLLAARWQRRVLGEPLVFSHGGCRGVCGKKGM